MSNTGFGQDRPYGAIDDDDDFIDEWRASWEPAARTHVDDVIEPLAVSPSEPAPDLEHVYEEGMYAPAPESESDEPPAAESVPPAPVSDPYDLESIHARAASDAPVNDLGAAIVSAHPLTPVATPAPVAEPEPVVEPEATTEAADVTEPEPVVELEPVADPELVADGEPQGSATEAFVEPEPEAGEQPDVIVQPEGIADPETEADEPGLEPLVAPDDVSDLDLVDWEPQPSSARSDIPAEAAAPEESLVEPEEETKSEPQPEAMDASSEQDHSIGLTGAAAAALAAASAWGVWSGTPAVPSMPAENPMEIAEASPPSDPEFVDSESFEPEAADFIEPEAPESALPQAETPTGQPETHDVTEQQPEPVAAEAEPTPDSYQPSGLFVPEPEVLTIPEPKASDAPEAPDFPADIATTRIPEPDMYAAPGRSPFTAAEPEPYVIPEPEPVSGASVFAPPTGDTTPIPEPGFVTAQPTSETPIDQAGETTEPFEATDTAPPALAPDYTAHEHVHTLATQNPAYDLIVDVSSIVIAPRFVQTESAGVASQAEELAPQRVLTDDPEPWAPPAEAEPEPEAWSPTPETTPSDSAVPERQPTPDPWAFTPPPIPESIFAPPTAEEPAPAWTPPFSAPEPSPSVPDEEAPTDPGEAPSWTMPASAWSEPDPDEQPTSEGQAVPSQPESEGDHSKWFDRAKMWAANNLYDPDDDDSVTKPEDGHGQHEPNR